MSEHSGVQCPALFYPFPKISPPWQATPFERCHLHCLGSTTFSWGLGSRMSSALVASIFGKAKQETLPVHNAVPPPQPPGDGVIDNPDSHLRFRFHTALSSPLPSPLSRSLTTRILIYSHWQSYLHSDAIMRQDSLLRAEGAPGMWGGFGTLLEGWGALRPSRVVQAGLISTHLFSRGNVQTGTAPTLPCSKLAWICSVCSSQMGSSVGAGRNGSEEALLSVRHCTCS